MPLGFAGHPGGGPLFWLLIEIASYRERRASQLLGTMITRRGLPDGVVGGVVVGEVVVGGVVVVLGWGPAGGCALVGAGTGNGNVEGMTMGGSWGMIVVPLGRVDGVGVVGVDPVALGVVAGGFEVVVGRGWG